MTTLICPTFGASTISTHMIDINPGSSTIPAPHLGVVPTILLSIYFSIVNKPEDGIVVKNSNLSHIPPRKSRFIIHMIRATVFTMRTAHRSAAVTAVRTILQLLILDLVWVADFTYERCIR